MQKDPLEIYGWRIIALSCSACKSFGGMLFGWDIGAISGILEYSRFEKTTRTHSLVRTVFVSTLQAGCFFASLVASVIADQFGRKWPLAGAGILTCLGVALQAGSRGSLACMYVGRLIAGFGMGAASMLTPLYVSECAPRAIRGGLTGLYQLFIVTGTMISFWINYGMSQTTAGAAVYEIPLSLQAIPAVILFFAMVLCPESPRWCARNGQWSKAARVLSKLSNLDTEHPYIRRELQDMAEQLDMERRLIGRASSWTLLKEMWLIPGNRKRALISVGLMVCQQMTGTNTINYYAPQIFENMGLPTTRAQLFATGIYGVVKMVSSLGFLIFAADSLGRRKSLLMSSVGQAVSLYVIGVYERWYPSHNESIPPFGYVAIVCVYLYVSFFQFGWGPCCWIYVSEIPTARLRTLNVAIAAATQWLINFIIARSTLTIMKSMGYVRFTSFLPANEAALKATWLLFGTFCIMTFFFAYFLIPETKGMSLEKMDKLFGITDDFLRVVDENKRERAASRMAVAEEANSTFLTASLRAGVPALPTLAEASEKLHAGSMQWKDEPVYRL
ncbi:galactose-proton symporter [Coniella lustricola]|uniref:Galactose-proton symporter n=1 Tax=Coniella lustricola TaxID=2025994 RepID=A0A2T3AJT7_9PEZI|nr:galactose-proton symporter [Coniella lustricola]